MTSRLRFALIGLAVFAGGFVVTGVSLSLLGGGDGSAQPASAGLYSGVQQLFPDAAI